MNTDRTLNVSKSITRLDKTVKNWKWWVFLPLGIFLLIIAVIINANVAIASWYFSAWNWIDRKVSDSLRPLTQWLNRTNQEIF